MWRFNVHQNRFPCIWIDNWIHRKVLKWSFHSIRLLL
jgi:hypothetical protein